MKKAIILILLIFSFSDIFCQEIKSLVIQTQQHNEPPTVPGPAKFEIEFIPNKSGDLYSEYYLVRSNRTKKVRLKDPIRIPKEDIDLFLEWKEIDKSIFSLDEIGTNIDELNNSLPNVPFKPEIPILEEFIIDIDSLTFCSKYQTIASISTGGYIVDVFLETANEKVNYLSFDSEDRRNHKFDLKEYLHLQPLLKNKLPDDFLKNEFFSKEVLLDNLLYYRKLIECEDYYYQEFVKNNPKRTNQENRMRKGWNFEEYLRKKIKP